MIIYIIYRRILVSYPILVANVKFHYFNMEEGASLL